MESISKSTKQTFAVYVTLLKAGYDLSVILQIPRLVIAEAYNSPDPATYATTHYPEYFL